MNATTIHKTSILAAVVVLFVSGAGAAAGMIDEPRVSIQPRPASGARSDIRVDTNLVLIPVSVTDPRNHPVTDLPPEGFRIFEGKAEQKILQVSTEDAPLSVGIVFDSSGSMASKQAKAREAVAGFLKGAGPRDEFFLVDFNNATELAVPFTTDTDEIEARLLRSRSDGKTALLDAVYLATQYMKKARNPRRALLIISDGGENESRYSEREIRRLVQETDVWIYAIGVYPSAAATLPEEERGGPKLLTDLSEKTGGRHFAVHNANELPAAAAKIGLELRNQYILAYSPMNGDTDGKYRRVQVKLSERGDLHLSWRPGYYAPGR